MRRSLLLLCALALAGCGGSGSGGGPGTTVTPTSPLPPPPPQTTTEQPQAAIVVESPESGASVSSPFRVRGTANTFEATFQLELRTAGRTLVHQTVTATSGSGTRGTFDAELRYSIAEETRGELVAYEFSAATGERINVVRIPISLLP